MAIDLNVLRDVIRINTDKNDPFPNDPSKQVVVDRNGNLQFGTTIAHGGGPTTRVPIEVFAAVGGSHADSA